MGVLMQVEEMDKAPSFSTVLKLVLGTIGVGVLLAVLLAYFLETRAEGSELTSQITQSLWVMRNGGADTAFIW
ncbi:MAG: hypothetical protein CMI58_02520 [Parcubacteria group bacterium]|jgi:hypothetical protein|nr:hypothetical protein [Parcubacteria group bacterium]